MKTCLILVLSFTLIHRLEANDVVTCLIVKGLPVKVISSGQSYKVFEQYRWEGHASKYGPKGSRLNPNDGAGVGKRISRLLHVRYGDWIHLQDIGRRQVNEVCSKSDGIAFYASHRDQYKGRHLRVTIDAVVFALLSPIDATG